MLCSAEEWHQTDFTHAIQDYYTATLKPLQNGHHFANDILKFISLNSFIILIEILMNP